MLQAGSAKNLKYIQDTIENLQAVLSYKKIIWWKRKEYIDSVYVNLRFAVCRVCREDRVRAIAMIYRACTKDTLLFFAEFFKTYTEEAVLACSI